MGQSTMITRLRVRNFKSLRDMDLPLGPLNVLVGPNMAGKSNILDVFRFLLQVFFPEASTQGIWYAIAQRGGPSEVVWKGGEDKLISMALEGTADDEPGTNYKYELQLIVGAGDYVAVQNETLKLLRGGNEIELLRQEGGFHAYVNADGKQLGSVGQSGASAFQYPRPDWDGHRFREWVRNWRFYHLVPPAMKQPSQMSLGQVLMPNGDNLSSWLMWVQTHSPEAFGKINEVLRDLLPDVMQVKTIPTPDGKVHLAFLEKGLRRPTTVWQASDGVLVLAAILSLIYAPPELGGTLFCVEEPENHLHPRLLETLVALLRQVRQEILESKQGLTQIIITTQSPYLVDQMTLDEVTWIEKKDGQTRAYRPADKEHLRRLVQDKALGIGDLMFSGALGEEK
jgi:predicted ATPase